MIEEPREEHGEETKEPVAADSPGRLAPQLFFLAGAVDLVVGTMRDFLRWVAGSTVRLSVASGIVAGLIVLLGFLSFDLRRDEWMLKERYPQAVNAYERRLLYARDLYLREQAYDEGASILRKLADNPKGGSLRNDALCALCECLSMSARDEASTGEARTACERFMAECPADPRVPTAYMMAAEGLARNRLYIESDSLYKKLLQTNPSPDIQGEAEFLMARNRYGEGAIPAAVHALERVRQTRSGTPAARDSALLLARVYGESGRPGDTEQILKALIGEAPGTPHAAAALNMLAENALDAGEPNSAVAYCTRWFKESPLPARQGEVMLTLARAQLATGAATDALTTASEIVTFFPDSPKSAAAAVLKGDAYEAMGRTAEAETAYLDAVRNVPNSHIAHAALARFYSATGETSGAMSHMERAVELAPDNEPLLLELAKLYRSCGENVSAVSLLIPFTRERQLSPHIADAFLILSDVQIELGQWQEAYMTLERLLATGTTTIDDSAVYVKQADLLSRAGLTDDAVEAYRKAVQAGADKGVTTVKLGQALLIAGKPDGCLREIETVDLAALPAGAQYECLELRAKAHFALEQYDEARRSIRRALSLQAKQEKISGLALLMHANLALGDDKGAGQVYRTAIRSVESGRDTVGGAIPAEAQQIVLEWAQRLYDTGQYVQAAEVYSHVDRPAFPPADVAWALYQRGNCFYHTGDYDKATEAYARLTAEYADSEWVRFAAQRKQLIAVMKGV
jgi:tetratricopeptide (TPR) repeat protein